MLELKKDKYTAKRVRLDEENKLIPDLSKLNKYYGINIIIKQENKEALELSFEYSVKSTIENKTNILTINRYNLLINKKKQSNALEELAYKCGEIIYPLKLSINKNLELIKIVNHENIIRKWVDLRDMLLGESPKVNKITKDYIKETQKNLMSNSYIMGSIKNNIFLSSLFMPIYKSYSPIYNNLNLDIHLPAVPNTKLVKYSIEQKILKNYTKFNTITVTQKGSLTDDRSAYDISRKSDEKINSGNKAKGKIKMIYQLNRKSKIIDSIVGNYNIQLPYGESRDIKMTAFHLKEKE